MQYAHLEINEDNTRAADASTRTEKQVFSHVLQSAWKSNFRERVKCFQPAGTRRDSLTKKKKPGDSLLTQFEAHTFMEQM